jgi:membrane-associated protein
MRRGIYLILFIVIFIETGLAVLPFLPGDSLLWIAGALAATGMLDLSVLIVGLVVAAVSGDALNYAIGAFVRRCAIDTSCIPLVEASHFRCAREFFDRRQKYHNSVF